MSANGTSRQRLSVTAGALIRDYSCSIQISLCRIHFLVSKIRLPYNCHSRALVCKELCSLSMRTES